MRKTLLRLVPLAVGLTLLAACGGDEGDVERIEVVAPEIDRIMIDLGRPGTNKGDQILIRKNLFFKGNRSRRVGENAISCVIVDIKGPQKFTTMCTVVNWFFGRGQIMGQELIELDFANPGRFDMAITGGTGSYRSVKGLVRILRTEEDHELVFLLDR